MTNIEQAPVGAAREANKPEIELADDADQIPAAKGMNETEQENAVGYREYLEAMDLQVTEREVGGVTA
jgi:hypothetical protein